MEGFQEVTNLPWSKEHEVIMPNLRPCMLDACVKDNLGPIWILATNSQLLKVAEDLFGTSANKPTNVLPTIQLTIAISALVSPS